LFSFAEFLADAVRKGEAVNTLFEERLFDLVGVLHRISDALTAEHIPHELIGGLAVLIHVEAANPEHSTLTRDVDVMVDRADLDRIKHAAATTGMRFRHEYRPARSEKSAVRLMFSCESFNPPIRPEPKHVHGKDVLVIPVADLVRMKLSSYRLKDQGTHSSHGRCGLITSEIEKNLEPDLVARLKHVRETE
jgi:hypothetical protein